MHERRFALNRVLEAAVELGSELQGAVTLHWAAVAPVIVVALRRADSVLCVGSAQPVRRLVVNAAAPKTPTLRRASI